MKATRTPPSKSDPNAFAPGQRWVSETQPEFGLALIVKATPGEVQVLYPAAEESVTYSAGSAPLRRVVFGPGDTVTSESGASFQVAAVREEGGCLIYVDGEGKELPESGLSDTMSFQNPDGRLLAGLLDEGRVWKLRQRALEQRHAKRSRPVRGLTGGRISLIPHQLYIADEVARRFAPRVLLADEVGLGKTIEACLILHRLHLSGRARRILILVPDALVHQWFVELLRRFQLHFSIFDEERAAAIDGDNPFFDEQLVLCATSWLSSDPVRAGQAAAGEWDLLIVDEAHHLEWTPEKASDEYRAVAAIAEATEGLLLLTATPEQLGREGHFARLQLLDPDRFSDLGEFIEESGRYEEISRLADKVRSDSVLDAGDLGRLRELLGEDLQVEAEPDVAARRDLTARLLDLHGTGRVMFRNRRGVLAGFPRRIARLHPVGGEGDVFDLKLAKCLELFASEEGAKFLLICHTREMAERIEEAIAGKLGSTAGAIFHEGLSLIQRDRNAAWFADEDGARVLVCSEIGSEGRNFQFAHHLVLWDLPDDPALLEQRIGRLDRIGQTEEIHIHVPYVQGTVEELWAMWYHKGLAAFEHTLHGSGAVFREFHDELAAMGGSAGWEGGLSGLLDRTVAFREKVACELEEGRDHLLEISSFDADRGEDLVEAIEDLDEDWQLEKFFLSLLDHLGVSIEDLDEASFLLKPEHVHEALPGIPESGLRITFDREVALAREEIAFVTWDHPLVAAAIDSLLSSERGNATFAQIGAFGEQALLLEATYVLETVAPAKLHADRFLPPRPLSVIIDHTGADRGGDLGEEMRRSATAGHPGWIRQKATTLRGMLPGMLRAAEGLAEGLAKEVRGEALDEMKAALDGEIRRLESLRELGHPVRGSEIVLAREEREKLEKHLDAARLRLDSLRLIVAS